MFLKKPFGSLLQCVIPCCVKNSSDHLTCLVLHTRKLLLRCCFYWRQYKYATVRIEYAVGTFIENKHV